ncbi:MAG: DUF4351 domain-containing protein [Cyanobacteria bacterium J06639_16]
MDRVGQLLARPLTFQTNTGKFRVGTATDRLEEGLVRQILRGEVMKESVVYQGIKAEGIEEGLRRGRQEGRQEGECALIMRLLSHKFGVMSPVFQRQIEGLDLPQLDALGEALLTFEALTDLEAWLAKHSQVE